jgi:putative transposase
MAQSLTLVLVHIIFSTKNRSPFLQSTEVRSQAHAYIAEQEIHHRRMTFQDEFRALLNKHGIRFDERYVWD